MPYAFAPRAGSTTGEVTRWDVPMNQWLGLKFEAGAHDTIFSSISRFTEDQIWDGQDVMQPDVASATFGIPGYLKFDAPVSIQRARLMRERKDEELRRMTYLNSATHSSFGVKAALGTASGMFGAVANPLDFATMFIPFVGSSARAAGIAKMGGGALRQFASRGLLAEEVLAFTRFPRFGAAVINGTMGNAVTEIPVFAQNVRDQAIYGPEDAAANIFLGGATAGLFHIAGAAFGKLLGLSADAHNRLPPDVQDASARDAINAMLDDRPISIDKIAKTDREAILRDLQFNEVAARRSALERIGILPEEAKARAMLEELNHRQASAVDLLDMARAKANTGKGTVEGTIAARLLERFQSGDRSVTLFQQMAELFDVRYNPLAPTLQERLKNDMLNADFDDMARTGSVRSFKEARTELFRVEQTLTRSLLDLDNTKDPLLQRQLRINTEMLQRRRDAILIETEKAEALVNRQGQPLSKEELSAHADELAKSGVEIDDMATRARAAQLEARADEVRESRIQEYIDGERARHQASLEGRVDAETASRLKQEVENGKILTPEQVKELTKDPTDESGMTAVKDSIANLEAELKAIPEDSPFRDLVAKTMKEIDEDATKDISKAYDVASECLIASLK